jgi:hypothetical protein
MPLDFTVGLLSQGAVGIEATYGVEKLCDTPFALISETLSDTPTLLRPPVLDGRPQGRQSTQGTTAIAGDVVMAFRYGLANPFLRNWFGAYDAATGLYTHATTTSGQSLTIALRKGATVWSFSGCKVHQLTLAAGLEIVTLTASVYATDFSSDSALNTDAVLHALVDPADDVLFRHMTFRAGEQDDAMTALDALGFTSFTLTLGRPLDQVYTNEGRAAIEGAETARPTVTVAFSLPRHRSNQWQTWKTDKTTLQMDVAIANPAGGDTKTLSFPQVEIATAPINIAGPGAVVVPVSLMASEAERVLRSTAVAAAASGNTLTITAAAGGAATGTLTLDTQPTAGDTMTLGTRVYTFQAIGTLTNVAGHVEVGASVGATQTNLRNAVNGTGVPGTGYAAATTAHPDVTMGAFAVNAAVVTAREVGTAGNSIATTETFTAVTNVFAAATLTGGVAGDNDVMPFAVPGATVWVTSPLNNGVAEVVSRTDLQMVLTTAAYKAAHAGHDGFDLASEAVGAAFRIVARSPDVFMTEVAA